MDKENTKQEAEHEFYIIRTAQGKEDRFFENSLKVISKKEESGIYSMFRPESVKGYIFVEAKSLSNIIDSFRGIPNNFGIIKTPISIEELNKYFEKKGEEVKVNERDIVEIISGPFKGDKARVIRIVPGKEDIIIEPINMAIPIPITLNKDDIRVIESNDSEDNEY